MFRLTIRSKYTGIREPCSNTREVGVSPYSKDAAYDKF